MKVNRTLDELQHSTFDGILGINVPSPCFTEEDEGSCCAGATVVGKYQERTCGTQLSIPGNCKDVGASCSVTHRQMLHHVNASRMSANQGSGSCLEHLGVAQGFEESDLGRPHVNAGTNSCSGIGTHQNSSGSVDVENPTVNSQQQAAMGIGIRGDQLDLAKSVDFSNGTRNRRK